MAKVMVKNPSGTSSSASKLVDDDDDDVVDDDDGAATIRGLLSCSIEPPLLSLYAFTFFQPHVWKHSLAVAKIATHNRLNAVRWLLLMVSFVYLDRCDDGRV
jgi:hypothetical protein